MSGQLLDADDIFDSTAKKSGLERFADDGMRHRFAHVIASLNQNGVIPDWARPAALAQISDLVRTRLELERDWATYPEIQDEKIDRPLFAMGGPRTGTSAMQSLLALGDGCRTPLSWESHRPSPPPGMDPASDAQRIAAEHQFIRELTNVMPGLLLAHPFVDDGAFMQAEDEEIFAHDFHFIYPFQLCKVPVIPLMYSKVTELVDALRFHKKILQQLQWKHPTQRWVCKGTQHHFQVPEIWKVYPDATCVWTHRDPAIVIASMLGLMNYVFTPVTGIRIPEFAKLIVGGLAAAYEALYAAEWVNDPRLVHVKFDDFMHDHVGTIHRVYERAGLEISPALDARIEHWLTDPAKKSDRHGKYIYSLEQFGLNEADIRKQFAGYYERFLTKQYP